MSILNLPDLSGLFTQPPSQSTFINNTTQSMQSVYQQHINQHINNMHGLHHILKNYSQFKSDDNIQNLTTKEIYQFCMNHSSGDMILKKDGVYYSVPYYENEWILAESALFHKQLEDLVDEK